MDHDTSSNKLQQLFVAMETEQIDCALRGFDEVCQERTNIKPSTEDVETPNRLSTRCNCLEPAWRLSIWIYLWRFMVIVIFENELPKINSSKPLAISLVAITSCCTLISDLMHDMHQSRRNVFWQEQMSYFPSSDVLQSRQIHSTCFPILSSSAYTGGRPKFVYEGACYLTNLDSAKTFIM